MRRLGEEVIYCPTAICMHMDRTTASDVNEDEHERVDDADPQYSAFKVMRVRFQGRTNWPS